MTDRHAAARDRNRRRLPQSWRCVLGALALAALLAAPGAEAGEGQRYVAAILPSAHIEDGPGDFHDLTFGLGYGRRYPGGAAGREWAWEAGVFYNSYEEVAPYLLAGVSWRLAGDARQQLRAGGFAGIARYEQLSRQLKRDHGIPNIDGFMPILGLSASWRRGRNEWRLTTVPAGDNVQLILNLSVTRAF